MPHKQVHLLESSRPAGQPLESNPLSYILAEDPMVDKQLDHIPAEKLDPDLAV
jgi:hypothetical protein